MGGLGLGAWLLGRRADRHPRPAALYGGLEIAIGAFGLVSPFVLALAHRAYIAGATSWHLSEGPSLGLRFGLAAFVLLVPTTLMGGTLPILTRAFMGDERDQLKASLGWLYGLNTLGAVAGTALAGFFMIEHAGIRLSLWGTAAVNIALGGAARWSEAAAGVRAALATGLGTLRHPLPVEALGDVLARFAIAGPPALADSLLIQALALRPGWARLYALRANTALRLGQCAEAKAQFLTLLEFGMEVANAPPLLARCSRGERL